MYKEYQELGKAPTPTFQGSCQLLGPMEEFTREKHAWKRWGCSSGAHLAHTKPCVSLLAPQGIMLYD